MNVYVTNDPFLYCILRSKWYSSIYEFSKHMPRWSGYQNEPIVMYDNIEESQKWIKRLPKWLKENVINIILIRSKKIFESSKVQRFLSINKCEIIDINKRSSWNIDMNEHIKDVEEQINKIIERV